MKKLLYVILFCSITLSAIAELEWKCIDSEMDDYEGHWSNLDPCYDPVEDAVYKLSVLKDALEVNRYMNNQWMKNDIDFPGVETYQVKNCSSSFDEQNGFVIYFWFIRIKNLMLVSDLEEMYLAAGYPYYSAIFLNPGQFLVTYNPSESITGIICYPAISHALFFDGEKIHNYDHLWDSDWTASPMVWDERRNVVVKYGTGDFGTSFNAIIDGPSDCGDACMREWDGTTWTLRLDVPEPHPPKRMQRMVYDEARGVVVLVSILGETWEYDGRTWSNLTEEVGEISMWYRPQVIYDTAKNRVVLLTSSRFHMERQMWALEDDATTQTYSRRNVMEEGCEMRDWGETGVDCSFTSSTSWSRIIVVKTEDETAPRIGDTVTSGIWAADVLWEIKTDRPPDIDAVETTGTLVSISYTPEIVDRICSDTLNLQLFIARPDEAIGVPIADTLQNDMRSFEQWQTLPTLDHPPDPGEHGVFHNIPNRRFLFRCVKKAPFYGSPSGLPREDGQPASLCYAIGTTAPDLPQMIRSAILGRAKYTEEERTLLDQNADARLDIADLIHILGQ